MINTLRVPYQLEIVQSSHNPSLPSPENYPVKASNKNAAFLWETNVHADVLCAQSETLSNTALETRFLKKNFQLKMVLFSSLICAQPCSQNINSSSNSFYKLRVIDCT